MHITKTLLGTAFAVAMGSTAAFAQDTCAERGALDVIYCDANGDLVADAPTDPAKLNDPSTLVFAYTPVEDPAVYADIWKRPQAATCSSLPCNPTRPRSRPCARAVCTSRVSRPAPRRSP